MNKLNSVLLIDDSVDDNFFHERIIRKTDRVDKVISKMSGKEALEFIKSSEEKKDDHPELILLDINMPEMNGWEFLDSYKKLNISSLRNTIIMILTTSENPDHIEKANSSDLKALKGYLTKPLREEMFNTILDTHFN